MVTLSLWSLFLLLDLLLTGERLIDLERQRRRLGDRVSGETDGIATVIKIKIVNQNLKLYSN